MNQWEWRTILFGSEWIKPNSGTLHWIDEEFKGDDGFLHAVYIEGTVFGSDQNQNLNNRMPALSPIYFPEATFPGD